MINDLSEPYLALRTCFTKNKFILNFHLFIFPQNDGRDSAEPQSGLIFGYNSRSVQVLGPKRHRRILSVGGAWGGDKQSQVMIILLLQCFIEFNYFLRGGIS